jgi:hypothetical protein
MRDRPILFSGPMVRAILEGRKTQTRRVIPFPNTGAFVLMETKEGGWWPYKSMDGESTDDGTGNETPINCRYGGPGDRLWVKETYYSWRCKIYTHEGMSEGPEQVCFAADGDTLLNGAKWRPSIFMFRRFSRITLELTDRRVQRLQDITEEDALGEGVTPKVVTEEDIANIQISDCSPLEKQLAKALGPGQFTARFLFQMLWDDLNAKRGFGWDKNPWVWNLIFKRVAA